MAAALSRMVAKGRMVAKSRCLVATEKSAPIRLCWMLVRSFLSHASARLAAHGSGSQHHRAGLPKHGSRAPCVWNKPRAEQARDNQLSARRKQKVTRPTCLWNQQEHDVSGNGNRIARCTGTNQTSGWEDASGMRLATKGHSGQPR